MPRYAFVVATCMALLPVSALSAEKLPLADFTPDGTWDCKDQHGTNTGAVVIADISYAFTKADGRLGGYGKLFRITDNFDLPHFAVISGYMKDELHSLGIGLRGPRDNNHDLSGEIFVNVILSADGHGADDWECRRRERPD
jgi:hypothetical protein